LINASAVGYYGNRGDVAVDETATAGEGFLPEVCVAWEEATASGQPLASQLAAHEIARLSARIPGLWPPGPYALAAAAARVTEALAHGTRRRFSCFVAIEAGPVRAAVGSMPVELGPQGIERVLEPVLAANERTALENALERTFEV
jgi:malate/lactate dehydrogenase